MRSFSLLGLLLLGSLVFFTACDDDDAPTPTNEIEIRILEPTDGETVSDASDVHIHIEIEATDENHEVEVVLHPDDDTSNKIIDFDQHAHDKVITFEQDVDLSSFPAGTSFHLEVEACIDHDCEEKATADAGFSI